MGTLRKEERHFMIQMFMLKGFLRGLTSFMPLLAGLGCFWVYNSQNDEPLSPARTYSLIALFNGFVDPVLYGFNVFEILLISMVSNKRLRQLLMIDTSHEQEEGSDNLSITKGSIEIKNGNFGWVDQELKKKFGKGDQKKSTGDKVAEQVEADKE
jgi:hypothetical protein